MVGLEREVDVKPLSLTYSNCSTVSPNVRRGTYVFSSELRKSCIVKSEALDAPASAPTRFALKAKTNLGCEVIRRRRRVQTERGIYHIDSYEARHGQLRQGALLSQRRIVTQEEKGRALEAAKSFKSSNPFTLVVMRDAYVYSGFFMYLPAAFVIDHLPKINSNLTLWDPDRKPWTVRLVLGKGRGGLSAGWAKFSRVHNLERDDVCILELIRNKELQVHIFRVVEEILPLIHSSECFKKSELRLIM
ncbi:hypothetical protein QJS04_geneDACA023533 [Acorus gramineus]|uniref:TF-B3 domain-containing protein n=1 Tax=Acorus gramineus TaxID=55184 RepID=A0AAV9BB56_ACOGR|nr:hypothetical protein QJS04_geneDACA023533 [Acorus gramineus]